MIDWKERYEGCVTAEVGHLFVFVEGNGGYEQPGHPDYEPETFNWWITIDDEDRNDERAITSGNAPSLEQGKDQAFGALLKIALRLVTAIEPALATDIARVDWLSHDSVRLEDARGRMNNESCSLREAIDWLRSHS